jgi:small subunit ribosomal protein S19
MEGAKAEPKEEPSGRKQNGARLPGVERQEKIKNIQTDLLFKEERNDMARSLKKGPYIDAKLLKKLSKIKPEDTAKPGQEIKTWARASQISPEMIGYAFGIHNGREFVRTVINEDMVGHRLGEFSPTRKFVKHGGKMQREIEAKKKQ